MNIQLICDESKEVDDKDFAYDHEDDDSYHYVRTAYILHVTTCTLHLIGVLINIAGFKITITVCLLI